MGGEEASRLGNIRARAAADQDGDNRKNGSETRHHANRYTARTRNVPDSGTVNVPDDVYLE